jgi:hypothetical protein
MTFKIEIQLSGREETTVSFEGALDRAALAGLLTRCEAELRRGVRVRVWLRAGTQVETGVLEELVRMPAISVAAEASYLARWIERCIDRSGSTSGT